MADKKVDRNVRGGHAGPMTPGEVFEASHSKQGTPNQADVAGGSSKSALLERFREREERYRRDQSLLAQAEATAHPEGTPPTDEGASKMGARDDTSGPQEDA